MTLSRPHAGVAHLRYATAGPEDRDECERRQLWALRVVARAGGARATLREGSCVARGNAACEYTLTWNERPRTAAILGPAFVLAIVAFSSGAPASVPAILVVVALATCGLDWRRATRTWRTAEEESGAALRWLLAQMPTRGVGLDEQPQEDPGRPPEVRNGAGSDLPVLEQAGEFWRISYEGTTLMMRHSRGLALLAHLVRCPGHELHVRELDAMTPSGGSPIARDSRAPERGTPPPPGDVGEAVDDRALAEYRSRLVELGAELDEVEQQNDPGRASAIRAEMELLGDQLATRARRRVRRAPTDVERLRVAITRRIRAAMAQIAKHHPALGAHLEAHVSTGYSCTYAPVDAPR